MRYLAFWLGHENIFGYFAGVLNCTRTFHWGAKFFVWIFIYPPPPSPQYLMTAPLNTKLFTRYVRRHPNKRINTKKLPEKLFQMPPRVIRHQLTCPFKLTFGSFLIGRRHILVISRNHLEFLFSLRKPKVFALQICNAIWRKKVAFESFSTVNVDKRTFRSKIWRARTFKTSWDFANYLAPNCENLLP